jgi:proteasome accessory factor B
MGEIAVDKAERLINLTMALLASRRFLSKNEIYSIVSGYSGSAETKERMFERDKNDLRDLGLDIEVGSDDPLFDDEPGYRIDANRYSFDVGDLDGPDLALLSLAAAHWQNSLLSKSGQSAIRKLESISPASDTELLVLPLHNAEVPEGHFEVIWKAITNRKRVTFTYKSIRDSLRSIEPYGLTLNKGFWYLVGMDLSVNEVRHFKLIRMGEDLTIPDSKKSFELPGRDQMKELLLVGSDLDQSVDAQLLLANGRAHEIRALSQVEESSEEWEIARITIDSQTKLFELLARAGTSAKLSAPLSLRSEFVEWMRGKKSG